MEGESAFAPQNREMGLADLVLRFGHWGRRLFGAVPDRASFGIARAGVLSRRSAEGPQGW